MKPPPEAFVISLPRSQQRRRDIGRALDALGLSWSFFDGVEGKLLDRETLPDYDKTKRRLFFGRDLTPGEIGCLLSHRGVFKKMVDENIESALILEDDARLSPDLPQVLSAIASLPEGWDVVRFLAREKVYKRSRRIGPLWGKYELTRPFGTPGGAYGYVLTKKAAGVLLEKMRRNYVPNDTTLGRAGLNVYAVRPAPVAPDMEIESTIGEQRFDKTSELSGWIKVVYPVTRLGFKLWDTAQKYWRWWSSWLADRKTSKLLSS